MENSLYEKKNLGDIRKCVDLVWIMTQTNQVKNPLRHMEKFDERLDVR